MSFNDVQDLILRDEIRRRNEEESSRSLLSTKSRGKKSKKGQNQDRSR